MEHPLAASRALIRHWFAIPNSAFRVAGIILCGLTLGACSSEGGSSTPPPGTELPVLAIADVVANEGNTGLRLMIFTVTLTPIATNTVSVAFASSDGTARAGTDYHAANGRLVFDAGSERQQIEVSIQGDADIEADETLDMILSAPTNAQLAQSRARGTIVNDDSNSGISGLDRRPDNQTCIAPARPILNSSVAVIDPFPSLPNIAQPTKILLEPVTDPRWFVLRKSGQLVTFDPTAATSVSTYLDLSAVVRTRSEGGLLGMAFHPDYPHTPEIFLSYTIDHSGPAMRSVISRFILDNISAPGAGTLEQVILQVDQDFDNHNGGDIAFGADGYLYIGFGDGGSGGDPNNRAQSTNHLLGSMLRIDVLDPSLSAGNTYAIPADNPFAGNAKCGPGLNPGACPEIYAWGLRNPWRWSFDAATEQLWLADVGQGAYEEVDIIERGGNYGWRCREGAHNYNNSGCGSGLIDPVAEYPRSQGNSITGGLVYRGAALPELIGRYVFADYGSGRIWALLADGQGGFSNDLLIDTSYGPTSFAADQNGEIYFTDINNSRLRRLIAAGPPVADTIPDLLSNSGCTDPSAVTQVYGGLLPYDINAPFWSDGAQKERFLGLPNGTTITRNADGDWDFPNGTVIVKNFRLNGNLIETRHLMRHPDGVWAGYTYEWNAAQTDATRVRGGKTRSINGQSWIFPAENQCLGCHTSAAGFALGAETAQLNRLFDYPASGRNANQLETFEHILMFTTPLPGPVQNLPLMAQPTDTGANLEARARAYLHTNCAQCHRPGGPTPAAMDLRYETTLTDTNTCNAIPLNGDLGVTNARLLAPGDAMRSLLILRAARRDSHGMPPLGSSQADTAGINLLTDWINGRSDCP